MATLTINDEAFIEKYGPHLNYQPAGGWNEHADCDLVKTHCCFCGVQCGIQLKVHENKVVGFEPWEEFPVNRGMLCPKGVKRYLQNEHPDRLLKPMLRTDRGFREATWDDALDYTVNAIRKSRMLMDAMRSPCWAAPR